MLNASERYRATANGLIYWYGEPFLYTGITLAILKPVGTIPVSNKVLNKTAKSSEITILRILRI